MARFDDCVQMVFSLEGGYSDAPGDHGGRTQYGVTQAVYSAWRRKHGLPDQSVQFITYVEASQIYFENYWTPAKCGQLEIPVDVVVFDMSINAGVSRAVKILQSVVGAATDGVIGPATMAAVELFDPKTLAIKYLNARESFYRGLAATDPTQQKFLNGWINRVNYLRGIVGN